MPSEYFAMLMSTLELTPTEKQMVIERRKGLCPCPACPTYRECATTAERVSERAFCTTGKSRCITEEEGCICPGCPLAKEMHLRYTSPCLRGSEKQQRILDSLGIR